MKSPSNHPYPRPVTVTILAILVLIIAIGNLIRFWSVLDYWDTLIRIGIKPGPYYIAATGLFWAFAGFWLFWLLWNRNRKCRIALIIISTLYFAFIWLDKIIFQSHITQKNTLFTVGVQILVVFYTIFTLLLPSNQGFFSRKNDEQLKG